MANELAGLMRSRRNIGFSGDEGDMLNAQADQDLQPQTNAITNKLLGYPDRPQIATMSNGRQGIQNRDGSVTFDTDSGQMSISAAQLAANNSEVQRQQEIANLQRQAQVHQLKVEAGIVPKEVKEPHFDADLGGFVYPPDATNPQGKFIPVAGAKRVKEEKPLTEYQGQSVAYGTRLADSHNLLNQLEEKIDLSGLKAKQTAENIPLIGGITGGIGNMMISPEQRQVDQAQRNFVNATLRRESGATISPPEFDNATKQYFPSVGDDPETIALKRRNRQLVINGMARGAGSGRADIEEVARNNPYANGNKLTTSASPALSFPSVNQQGWVLHTDASGRTAYVSPDGKQFKEVR